MQKEDKRQYRREHFGSMSILCFFLCLFCGLLLLPAQPAFAEETDPGESVTAPPPVPALSSLKSKAVRKATVTWKTVKGADGYDIWYRTGEDARIAAVKPGTKKAKTLKGLKGGKKYTCRVRSFRLDPESGDKVCSDWSSTKTVKIKHNRWSDLQEKYAPKEKVDHLIFVKYKGDSKATLILYEKKGTWWKKVLSCKAYTGEKGLDKEVEGDRKTPTGTFTVTKAFGVKKDPGSKIKYTKLNKNHYWCGDRHYYNRMINIKKHPHDCKGEHLIHYKKQYAYALAFDYNKKNKYGKGSAIFLHCFGYHPYTLGCVSVSRKNMKKILRSCGENTKVCIYRK